MSHPHIQLTESVGMFELLATFALSLIAGFFGMLIMIVIGLLLQVQYVIGGAPVCLGISILFFGIIQIIPISYGE